MPGFGVVANFKMAEEIVDKEDNHSSEKRHKAKKYDNSRKHLPKKQSKHRTEIDLNTVPEKIQMQLNSLEKQLEDKDLTRGERRQLQNKRNILKNKIAVG